ncbi:PREDICTED: uncharacterized protein LOC105973839 [Erythranthe guttata]|uniref:uncharacterized protein LOC105973839 n=1 Tax=Erythranthe guttata TaxID=4155 RepID=UPI00064DB034|nr:PREDICTED: uncharacterized protein LOC105973839 [Erythranthe guttata]|eukprot:XP_012854346.1 PREDICTED: uncharacterized protein LOC105973839 [Erythranthe guttata]
MNCIFWNCQGLGAPLTIHVLGDIIRDHQPRLVFLSETRATLQLIEKLKRRWNLNGLCVEKVGQSRGLALFWQKDLAVDLISYSNNHIDAEVSGVNHNSKWRVTGFYGFPEHSRRQLSWNLLRNLGQRRDLPWLIGGDFNEILSNAEKTGGPQRLPSRIEMFREALDECGLIDMGYEGIPFTWSNNRTDPCTVRCRLDRVCASNEWLTRFPNARVQHLSYAGSDHIPIKLIFSIPVSTCNSRRKRPFRFKATWLRRDDCEQIIEQQWTKNIDADPMEALIQKNNDCRLALIQWSKLTVKQPRKMIETLHKRIQNLNMANLIEGSRHEIRVLRAELERAYEDEDLVDRIKNAEGIWQEKPEDIEKIISDYFEHVFKSTNLSGEEIDEVLASIETRITGVASQLLSTPFTSDEFGQVLPSRGLRQGDPLSPYLFICCVEALIAMISAATARGDFQGVRVAPTAPTVSSLCFADDTLIFGKATEAYACVLKDILDKYVRVSGQEINHEKSTMMFSPSTPPTRRNNIHQILGFHIVDRHEKYLGLPATIGNAKKNIFAYLRDRVWSKIKGWGEKQLSKAGKEVLIKAVLQAIPSYVMSCFLLPACLIKEIEAAIRRLWWGNGANKGMAWLSWS